MSGRSHGSYFKGYSLPSGLVFFLFLLHFARVCWPLFSPASRPLPWTVLRSP